MTYASEYIAIYFAGTSFVCLTHVQSCKQ